MAASQSSPLQREGREKLREVILRSHMVLGPSEIPKLKSQEEVGRIPALAVRSALAHYQEPDGMEVVVTGLKACEATRSRWALAGGTRSIVRGE